MTLYMCISDLIHPFLCFYTFFTFTSLKLLHEQIGKCSSIFLYLGINVIYNIGTAIMSCFAVNHSCKTDIWVYEVCPEASDSLPTQAFFLHYPCQATNLCQIFFIAYFEVWYYYTSVHAKTVLNVCSLWGCKITLCKNVFQFQCLERRG